MKNNFWIACVFALLLFCSCDKGYQIRFSNYYTERIDSVFIGNKIKFGNVGIHTTTEFKKIDRGHYNITALAKNKTFNASIFIPGHGQGNRTIQIDAGEQISILEE